MQKQLTIKETIKMANHETRDFFSRHEDALQDNVINLLDCDETTDYGDVFTMVNGFLDQLLEDSGVESGFFSDAAVQRVDLHEITQTLCDNNNIEE